jgi:hypothetical protein
MYDGSASSAYLTGLMAHCAYDECPQAEITTIALEYGTVSLRETLDVLRGEEWLRQHPQADAAVAAQVRQRIHDAFFIDTPQWKQTVLAQARQAMRQAVDGLAA